MTICVCNKGYSHVSLNQYIDHNKREIKFYVTVAIRDGDMWSGPGLYREYDYKSFKAAYNKYEQLIQKYNLAN